MKLSHVQFDEPIRFGGKDINAISERRKDFARDFTGVEYDAGLACVRVTLKASSPPRPEGDVLLVPREKVTFMSPAPTKK